jgi:hypothetical protein
MSEAMRCLPYVYQMATVLGKWEILYTFYRTLNWHISFLEFNLMGAKIENPYQGF